MGSDKCTQHYPNILEYYRRHGAQFCRVFAKLQRATCRRFDTIPACDGRTDGQTDGIAVANTVLAMRALRAVKVKTWFSEPYVRSNYISRES